MKMRNIAIIAHVDHGKTTLVDQLLKKSGTFRDNEQVEERAMDSNDIERERGITILAKTTAINYNGYRINILDTPGHADFGGEVERIMNMVDGVLLVVDAYEGTMPQTRFVLKKALEANVKPLVIINKVDKPTARVDKVLDEVIDLFIELGATDEQLDFKVAYVSALNGTASLSPDINTQQENYDDIFNLIIDEIPEPRVNPEGNLQFQPALLDYNDYVGRIGIGLIKSGHIKVNEMVSCVRLDGSHKQFRIQKLFGFIGLKRIEIEEAHAGDIVAIAGLADISVGETVCNPGKEEPLPILRIDEPTLKMTFMTNDSPFVGKDGKFVTASKIGERLFRETQKDVSLRVEQSGNESWTVSGRGELHLSILIENMRREGYELQVSKPEVIIKEIEGEKYEPYEDVQIEVPEESVGSVIEALGLRGARMDNMSNINNLVRLNYTIPSRGLIGFNTDFMTMTKGYGIINHTFKDYEKIENITVGERKLGVLVSMENGKATAYAIGALEDRGIMFIEPGTEVYEGMIVGECNRDNDLAINVVKGKQLTNTRAAGSDHTVVLKRPRPITLEYALDYINSDELVEVTPENIRLRKQILNTEQRKKFDAKK
jgi:GTP-binding protein